MDGSLSRRHGGSGLGLSISRRLVELMGGSIYAESVHGKGSRLTFRVPAEVVWMEPEDDRSPCRRTTPAQPEARSAPGPLPVLLGEDNRVKRVSQHSAAAGGEGARGQRRRRRCRRSRSRDYDLVLMDVQMPGIDGLQTTRLIRALPNPGRSTLPIIALTASAFLADREKCLTAGMNDHLAKPVTVASFEGMLRKWHPET